MSDLWVWEDGSGRKIEGEVQVLAQTYDGHVWHADGSSLHGRGRHLADGSWFEVWQWVPPSPNTDVV